MKKRDLDDLIDFTDFSYRDYINAEKTILTPQLRNLGYHTISFVDGEADNLGPMRRLCRCTNKHGKRCEFYYGPPRQG